MPLKTYKFKKQEKLESLERGMKEKEERWTDLIRYLMRFLKIRFLKISQFILS